MEDEAAERANRILFCDTDLIVTEVWAEIYKVKCPRWIIEENHRRHYDLWILLRADVPWEQDTVRQYLQIRNWHFERLESELRGRGLPFVIVGGSYEERIAQCRQIVDDLLAKQKA